MNGDRTPLPEFEHLPQIRVPVAPVESVAPAPEFRGDGGSSEGINWRQMAAAVRRFKWIVVAVTVLGTVAGLAIARFLDPTYSARATLWVDTRDVRARDQGPVQSSQLVGSSGWVGLLESHMVLDDVVLQLRRYLSWQSPSDSTALAGFRVADGVRPGAYRLAVSEQGGEFTLTTDAGDTLQRGAVGDAIGARLGFVWQPDSAALRPGRTIEFRVALPAGAAAKLASQLRVRTDLLEGKVGNFLTVELRGSSPSRVTDLVNAIAERFVAVATDLRRQKLSEVVHILGEQVDHSQRNLDVAELALSNFQVRAVSVAPNAPSPAFGDGGAARDPAFAAFLELKAKRDQLNRDRVALEQILAQADAQGSVDGLEAIGAVLRSSVLVQALRERTDKQAELRALRYRYSDEHLPVRRLAADLTALERHTIPDLVRGLIAQLAAWEAEQAEHVDSLAAGLRRVPALAIQEDRLRREVTIAEQMFGNISQRYEEARLAEVSSVPEVRILDRAVPPQAPLYNATSLLLALAFFGSGFAGILGVVVLDRLDPRVQHPDEVTRAMGLTILGVVPRASRRKNGDNGDRAAPVIEAMRGIRMRVAHAAGDPQPLLLTITSPGKGDGKSFVSSNLALAFADAGYRTLLIDADIRRGVLHRVFKTDRRPGLTELLSGAPRDDVIKPAGYPSLWLIGSGSRQLTGPEMLTSAPMARLLAGVRADYDVILVDSPPMSAAIDAFALGKMTGALLLVLRAGVSNRGMASAKLDVLDRMQIPVLGAVLNDARMTGEYKYYSYYLPGYEMEAGEAQWASRPALGSGDSEG